VRALRWPFLGGCVRCAAMEHQAEAYAQVIRAFRGCRRDLPADTRQIRRKETASEWTGRLTRPGEVGDALFKDCHMSRIQDLQAPGGPFKALFEARVRPYYSSRRPSQGPLLPPVRFAIAQLYAGARRSKLTLTGYRNSLRVGMSAAPLTQRDVRAMPGRGAKFWLQFTEQLRTPLAGTKPRERTPRRRASRSDRAVP